MRKQKLKDAVMAEVLKGQESEAILQDLLNPAHKITITQTEACPNGVAEKAVEAVMARIKAASSSSGQTPDVECLVSPSVKTKLPPEFVRLLPRLISHPTVFHGVKDFTSSSRMRLEDVSSYLGQGELSEAMQEDKALARIAGVVAPERDGKPQKPFSIFFTGKKSALISDKNIEFSLVNTDLRGQSFKKDFNGPKLVFSTKWETTFYSILHEIGHGWSENIHNDNVGQVTFTDEIKGGASETVADLFAANAYSCLADQGIVSKNEEMLRGIRDVRIFTQLTGISPDSYAGTAGIDYVNGAWRQIFSQEEIIAASRQIQNLMDQKLGLAQTDAAFLKDLKSAGYKGLALIGKALLCVLSQAREYGITKDERDKIQDALTSTVILGNDFLYGFDIGGDCGKNVERVVVDIIKAYLRSRDGEVVTRLVREISLEKPFPAGTAAAYLVEGVMKAMERIRPGFTDGTYKKPTVFGRLLRSLSSSA